MGNVIYPHRIRLRGPWQCEPLDRQPAAGEVPPPRTVRLPGRWRHAGLHDFAGRVRFTRSFGYPGQIDSWERVWLTFAGIEGRAEVSLNGTSLGQATGPCEFEVTSLLAARNRLDVIIESSSADAGLWDEVALEVRCTAYLQEVRARRDGQRVHVTGKVSGSADMPLDLYVLCDRHTVAYGTVQAGQPFDLTTDDLTAFSSGTLRIELVNLATIWHALDLPVCVE